MLGNDGFPKKQANGLSAEQGWECLAAQPEALPHIQHLHDELKPEGLWLWPRGAIEAHLSIEKSDSGRQKFLRQLRDTNDSTSSESLTLDQTVIDAIDWLRA